MANVAGGVVKSAPDPEKQVREVDDLDGKLDQLRGIGDCAPELREKGVLDHDTAIQYLKLVGKAGITAPEYIDDKTQKDLGIDPGQKRSIEDLWDVGWGIVTRQKASFKAAWTQQSEQLKTSRKLFYRYGPDIGSALLLAALPEAYAAKWGVRVLAATHQLESKPARRVRATAQWILSVVGPDGDIDEAWEPGGMAFRAVVGLRLFHCAVRLALSDNEPILGTTYGKEHDIPINQEDLLATKLTFCVGVFEVLERFGVSWTADEQLAYLQTWNFIGWLLGIQGACPPEPLNGEPPQLLPATVPEARHLLAAIRRRQWKKEPPVKPLDEDLEALAPGRILLDALLRELHDAMAPSTQGWPRTVMQQLCPPEVRERLGLGKAGLPLELVGVLPRLRTRVARFTHESRPNPVSGATLRFMANEVSRRAMVSFVRTSQQPPFVIPGFEEWSSGIRPK